MRTRRIAGAGEAPAPCFVVAELHDATGAHAPRRGNDVSVATLERNGVGGEAEYREEAQRAARSVARERERDGGDARPRAPRRERAECGSNGRIAGEDDAAATALEARDRTCVLRGARVQRDDHRRVRGVEREWSALRHEDIRTDTKARAHLPTALLERSCREFPLPSGAPEQDDLSRQK